MELGVDMGLLLGGLGIASWGWLLEEVVRIPRLMPVRVYNQVHSYLDIHHYLVYCVQLAASLYDVTLYSGVEQRNFRRGLAVSTL